MENSVKFLFSGDSALVIEFGNEISVDINKKIRKMMDNIKKENIVGKYKHSNILFALGWVVVLVTAYIGVQSLSKLAELFA